MRNCILSLCVAVLASTSALAQTALPARAGTGGAAFAQDAAMRAVNFKEGDAAALTRARADFTPEAWTAFIKWMGEYVDQKGTPKFTSSFVPAGDAIVVSQDSGSVHLKIPGTLKQSTAHGVTTYRSSIDVEAGGAPQKIRHFEVSICSAKPDSPVTPCR